MSESARPILEATRGSRNALTEYAFLAALTGDICQGRRDDADKLFADGTQSWIHREQHSAELRYLYAAAHEPPNLAPIAGHCVTVPAS